ncbi:MAG TPA: response regulator, partial [Rhodobacteraceae bacterium]|nr:response regulator [Paracoccaceae bacterium]
MCARACRQAWPIKTLARSALTPIFLFRLRALLVLLICNIWQKRLTPQQKPMIGHVLHRMRRAVSKALQMCSALYLLNLGGPLPNMKLPLLLVEDTSSLAMVYRSVLEKDGHKVVACDTISQAREEMEQQRFSVILLDLSLPDGDGMELMGDLLKGGAKVIVITANG